MAASGGDRRAALLAKFRALAMERLQKLHAALDPLAASPPPPELLVETLREIHTLKGESRMLGVNSVNEVSHATEDVLIRLKSRQVGLSDAERDVVIFGLDLCGALLQEEDFGPGRWAADVAQLLSDAKAVPAPTGGTDAASSDAPSTSAASPPLSSAASSPAASSPPASASTAPARQPGSSSVEGAAPVESEAPRAPSHSFSAADSVRIATGALANLTDTTGTLLLHHEEADGYIADITRLHRDLLMAVEELRASGGGSGGRIDSRGVLVPLLKEMNATVMRLRDRSFDTGTRLADLQETIRKLRLQPLATILEHIPPAARALGREHNKKLRVVLDDGGVSLDTQVLEIVDRALVHLIRNAVDHGIEPPDVRIGRNKPAEGTIRVSAREFGARVEIVVEDDGGGVDVERLREIATMRGVIDARAARDATPEKMLEVLFLPGFSTRSEASDVSGRGVGLDAVKAAVEGCGGVLTMWNRPTIGAGFRIEVPVSVALSRVVIVSVSDGAFAIPCASVVRLMDATQDDVVMSGSQESILMDGQQVPLSDLSALLGGAARPRVAGPLRIVVVEHQGRRYALVVSKILGERELLARALDPLLAGLRLVSATAILEGGRLVQLLNVAAVVTQLASPGMAMQATSTVSSAPARRRVLIVEDSELTRDMLVHLAGRLGVEPLEAVDGFDGLRVLERDRPDLVLTDLDMPVLDGIGMIERMRASPALRQLPVVVLSTRGSEQDKRRAMDAGANAYLVKAAFKPEDLQRVFDLFFVSGGTA